MKVRRYMEATGGMREGAQLFHDALRRGQRLLICFSAAPCAQRRRDTMRRDMASRLALARRDRRARDVIMRAVTPLRYAQQSDAASPRYSSSEERYFMREVQDVFARGDA